MPYTDDPQNVPADQVRFLVGDTDVSYPLLSDAQVAYLLVDQGDNVMRAAARAAETLAARYAGEASEKRVGPLTIISGTRATTKSQSYLKLAAMLWARASQSGVAPYVGGISLDDKITKVLDTDRVHPAFARHMQRYPNGSTQAASPEDLLSPPAEISN